MASPRATRAATVANGFLTALDAEIALLDSTAWPASKWAPDPVGFAATILGVETWGKQQAILESVRDNRHTAVSGGRKIGKDFVGGIAALWWYASFADARCMCFGPTMRQVDEIIYREIRSLWAGHGRCVKCKRDDPDGPKPCPHSAIMTGKCAISAKTGIDAPDLRQVIGVTAAGEGGARGFSGRMLVIEDEAADMKDDIDTAILGNLAGDWVRRLLISNPVRSRGFFFRAFHTERDLYNLFQISSEESPNVVENRIVHPGLATREWLAEREMAWGKGSPMWMWHVEGKFLKAAEGQLFSIDVVTDAELKWQAALAEGRLHLGVDPAGEGQEGDEVGFAARRGLRALEVDGYRGLSPDGIVAKVLDWIARWKKPSDIGDNKPVVVVDRDGSTGARVYNALLGFLAQSQDPPYEVIGFRGADRPKGLLGQSYKLNRDLLYGCLVAWFRDGGAIPTVLMLEAELLELQWVDSEGGRQILIRKSELRDALGRSPDRCDALALSTWREIRPFKTADDVTPPAAMVHQGASEAMDPYRAVEGMGVDEVFDPWRGI